MQELWAASCLFLIKHNLPQRSLVHPQVYGRDFFTGIAACIPANAPSQGQAIAAKALSQSVEFAMGDSLAAENHQVQT